jgi:hypothetical protein
VAARAIEVLHRGTRVVAARSTHGWRVDVGGAAAEARFLADALEAAGVGRDATQLSLEILAAEATGPEAQPAAPSQTDAPNTLAARPSAEPE